jgi:predicted GH43/DUF377 family glycosyl hydrolase
MFTKSKDHPRRRDIVHRYEANPVLQLDSLTFRCSDIHNSGFIEIGDIILSLVTVEHLSGITAIHLARPTGYGKYTLDETPFLSPSDDPEYADHEIHGVRDARITCLENQYYIVYNALGIHGHRLALAKTENFESVQRLGLISQPDTKAGLLFPEKINGRYARLERPSDGCIWLTYSDDLKYWGSSQKILAPRSGHWDANRIGAGPVPIKVDNYWLLVYYGAKHTSAGPIYRLGAALLDYTDPTKILGRTGIPILAPRENYERIGDLPNIVFSTGAAIRKGNLLVIAYGAANSCICLGTAKLEEVIELCKAGKKEY